MIVEREKYSNNNINIKNKLSNTIKYPELKN